MLRTMTKAAAPAVRAVGRAARPVVRKMATEAGETMPSSEELKRVTEFGRFVDDRFSLRLEKFVTKEDLFRGLEKLEGRIDKLATKESVKEGFQNLETKLKYFMVVGTGSVVLSGAMLAARAGFFRPPDATQAGRLPVEPALSESAATPRPA